MARGPAVGGPAASAGGRRGRAAAAEEGEGGAAGGGAGGGSAVSLELPEPTHVNIKTAEYVGSAVNLAGCPRASFPEFALIGRSNVGKSSLINMLCGQRALAKVAKTPGKTQTINHFLVNRSWFLVDLPGYGYARRSKAQREEFFQFSSEYFLERETLANALLLVDSSVPPQDVDLQMVDWLVDSEVPFSLVFTKSDKRKKKSPRNEENVAAFEGILEARFGILPPSVLTSAAKGGGKRELLWLIGGLRARWEQFEGAD